MAIQTDPKMYSGGAVVFDTQPQVNLYAQILAKKQAREEALDAYEMNRINRMNEQGVRDIDRAGLDQKVIDMKTYYQANKDKIRKGGTAEAYNYEKMFRDTLGGVSKSKNATARAETFNKIRLERQKLGRNTPEDWFKEYTQHEDTPIWDEKFQDLDLPKYMSQNTVKYDQSKSMKLLSGIKRTPLPIRYDEIPGQPDLRNEIKESKLDDEAKDAVRAIALNEYDNDDGFSNHVQSIVNDPLRRGRLEKLFEDNYKTKPLGLQDYAVAVKLEEMQSTLTTSKPVADWPYRTAVNQRNSLIKIGANKSAGGGTAPQDYTPDANGNQDITKYIQGIKINNATGTSSDGTGKSSQASVAGYNPKNKTITYRETIYDKYGDGTATDNTVTLAEFKRIIPSTNTVDDRKIFDERIAEIDKAFEKSKQKPAKKGKYD